ncbi:MAG TPA: ferritin-like domain-containing protein [Kofleriaceae bacterium]|nr:ferritin-like domain-containing protein [Kofleriaceae bacterium]
MTTKATKPTDIGMNRTGIATSPIDSKRLRDASEELTPFDGGDGTTLAAARLVWASDADPVGTMAPPASIKGAVKTGIQMLKGNKPNVFLDKLGERAAYERAGTRLWEAFLVKHAAGDVHLGGPTRDEIMSIRDDELRHYGIVRDAIVTLGADPTVMTPCADISGVLGMGLVQVVTDPRTTLTQCLEAMLVAELTDNDAWGLLANLADNIGQDEMANDFREALVNEKEHLRMVRGWLAAALRGQAGIEPTPEVDDVGRIADEDVARH